MRDKIKIKEYFDNYQKKVIEKILKRQKLIQLVISERGEDDAVRSARLSVLNYRMSLLISSYSSGKSIDMIKKLHSEILVHIEKTSFENRYVEMLWLVSMGILLDVSDQGFEKLTKIVKSDGLNDHLKAHLYFREIKIGNILIRL